MTTSATGPSPTGNGLLGPACLLAVVLVLPGIASAAQEAELIADKHLEQVLSERVVMVEGWTLAGSSWQPSGEPFLDEITAEETILELRSDLLLAHLPPLLPPLELAEGDPLQPLLPALVGALEAFRFAAPQSGILAGSVVALDRDLPSGERAIVVAARTPEGANTPVSSTELFEAWRAADHAGDFEAASLLLEFGDEAEAERARSWVSEYLGAHLGPGLARPLMGDFTADLGAWSFAPADPSAGLGLLVMKPGHPAGLAAAAREFEGMHLHGLAALYEAGVRVPALQVPAALHERQAAELEALRAHLPGLSASRMIQETARLGGALHLRVTEEAPPEWRHASLRLALLRYTGQPDASRALEASRALLAAGAPALGWGLLSAAVDSLPRLGSEDLALIRLLQADLGLPALDARSRDHLEARCELPSEEAKALIRALFGVI